MKAIVQNDYGLPGAIELKEVDKPEVKDDGVLVRVRAAGVNSGDFFRCKVLCRNCTQGGSPDAGQVPIVKQDTDRDAGLLVKQKHKTGAGRNVEPDVFGETCRDLDNDVCTSFDITIFYMKVAGRIFKY